ncbi:tetratricopeptide repeat protein [Aliifodinibius sp. S!AR15-10]|uniref:tetratricopeptide repeat protein n=1 Tax=Aliifodinibius sp. S!AR15-10 TaxID=2950437 RepID=UPI00285A6437|nr:tetratricopeptide repeat protein [Aliifodinibius sp. S!AR15-10]MDR8393366.1 tetratricopeptide repeat protein [Aliifodinibius sp. S!AR15-10]
MNRTYVLLTIVGLCLVIGIGYSCSQSGEDSSSSQVDSSPGNAQFVGIEKCQSCHQEQVADWQHSHHDYAMKKATDEYVRGDFDNTSFTHNGQQYRFYREGDRFMVEAPGPDGELTEYSISYTFGWEPLQQYLVDFGKGKLQALNIAWDTEKEEWFALNPEEDIRHGDWLHWTGGAMNWNTMCADCHSTNLKQNYIAEADSFHTTWSSINVSCESCHGPGKEHVELMQSEEAKQATIDRIREDLKMTGSTGQVELINQCAPCHALREKLEPGYEHKGDFMNHFSPTLPHLEAYFADGQIKEEVYVYGSFLQSKMYKKGVQCTDCHNPHTLELKANVTDNTLCMQCHVPTYNSRAHHFHEPNTESSQCINCHMPGRYYMEVDFRRDHSFRVPRPDLSRKFGNPNACNDCHDDRTADWAAQQIEQWYGPTRPDHFSEIFLRADSLGTETIPELETVISDTAYNDIVRATSAWYLGQFGTQASLDILGQYTNDESAKVRNSVARAISGFPAEMRRLPLQDALDDSVKAVRLAAAQGLAEFSVQDIAFNLKQPFNDAMAEYRAYLDLNQYFPQGQMNRGQYFEKQGQTQQAIAAYQKALEKDPYFNAARLNLAYLYNQTGQNERAGELLNKVIEQEPSYGPAHYSLALLRAEQDRLPDALPHFEKAASLMPQNHRVRYNWAISLQRLGQPQKAEGVYKQAIDLAPENGDYLYGICTLYVQQNRYQDALPYAQKLVELYPNNQRFGQLLEELKMRN